MCPRGGGCPSRSGRGARLDRHRHRLQPGLAPFCRRTWLSRRLRAGRFLVSAIESLAAHKPFFTARASETLLDSYLTRAGTVDCVLTPRERGVIQLIAEGHSNKQIANILTISVKTVETHRAAIMRKLSLTSAAALVRYAVRNKIIEA